MYIEKSCIQNRMFSMILTFLKCSNNSCKRVEHSYLNFQIRLLRENTKSPETCSASHRLAADSQTQPGLANMHPVSSPSDTPSLQISCFQNDFLYRALSHESLPHQWDLAPFVIVFRALLADVYLRMKITIFNHFLIILLSLEGYEQGWVPVSGAMMAPVLT